jgi:hypothetical protein
VNLARGQPVPVRFASDRVSSNAQIVRWRHRLNAFVGREVANGLACQVAGDKCSLGITLRGFNKKGLEARAPEEVPL